MPFSHLLGLIKMTNFAEISQRLQKLVIFGARAYSQKSNFETYTLQGVQARLPLVTASRLSPPNCVIRRIGRIADQR